MHSEGVRNKNNTDTALGVFYCFSSLLFAFIFCVCSPQCFFLRCSCSMSWLNSGWSLTLASFLSTVECTAALFLGFYLLQFFALLMLKLVIQNVLFSTSSMKRWFKYCAELLLGAGAAQYSLQCTIILWLGLEDDH